MAFPWSTGPSGADGKYASTTHTVLHVCVLDTCQCALGASVMHLASAGDSGYKGQSESWGAPRRMAGLASATKHRRG